MSLPNDRMFSALPPYLGGKRRLAPLIFSLLQELLGRDAWQHSLLHDVFSGGGAVSLYAKALGFHVVASDIAERAAIVGRALIANSSVRLRYEDVLCLFRSPAPDGRNVASAYVPSVFSAAQASWIDGAIATAERRGEPVRSLLLLVILKLTLRLFPMSLPSASDAGAAATGDFDAISSRRVGHYLRASKLLTPERAWSIAREVNAGVFGGHGEAVRADALTALRRTPADVVYFDPEYARTTGYRNSYAVIDAILGDDGDDGTPVPSLDELLDAARDVDVVLLSYGGPTHTLDELVDLVRRHRDVQRSLAIPYPHLRSVALEEKNATNQEYLIAARRRR